MDFKAAAGFCWWLRMFAHEATNKTMFGPEIRDTIGGLKGMNLAMCDSAQCPPEWFWCVPRYRPRDKRRSCYVGPGKLCWKVF